MGATMPGRNGGTLNRGNLSPGRPKKGPLTKALEQLVKRRIPKDAVGILEPLRGKKWADVMAAGLAMSAATGDAPAFREAADRIEGKVVTKAEVTGAEGQPLFSTDARLELLEFLGLAPPAPEETEAPN